MTLRTWKKEFYPVDAAHPMTERQAIQHSLKKWEGLLKINLKKHKMEDIGSFVSDSKGYYFEVDSSTCSLCEKYFHKVGTCEGCPLYKSLGSRKCHSWLTLNSPYSEWLNNGDPKPMIRALRKTLKDYDAGRLK